MANSLSQFLRPLSTLSGEAHALIAISALLICLSGRLIWNGATHHGKGVWEYYGGGDYTGNSGEDHTEILSESQYKRECYNDGFMLLAGGLLIAGFVYKAWREQDKLESSWKRAIKNDTTIQDIHNHPDLYREDFKKWIKENYPHLAFWDLPPNSSN